MLVEGAVCGGAWLKQLLPCLQVIGGLTNMVLWLRIPLAAPTRDDPAAVEADGAVAAAAEGSNNTAVPGSDNAAAAAAGGDGSSGSAAAAAQQAGDLAEAALAADPWEWWNQLRFLCAHSNRLGAALELGADLPAAADLARWPGEPVK